jgi:hypothetical protein
MKTQKLSHVRWLGILASLFLFAFAAKADPIELPEKPLTPEIISLISVSILLEAICILILLRHFRRPRFFILWILGLHLITYPAFLGLLWLFKDIRPASGVALGEGLIVFLEGTLIYLVCRFVPTKKNLPTASIVRCWLVSLAGNACSLIAFPFLIAFFDRIFPRY